LPKLAAEKLPLFAPVAVASLLAIQAQSQAGALSSWEGLPLGTRVGNAVLSYGLYLKKMVWPMDLAVFYPHPGSSLGVWPVALAALLLAGLSLGVWWQGRKSPYLVVGWLWYLGTLFPVSGVIQVGGHAMADRYAYVPLMGLFIILAWGAAELAQTLHLPKAGLLGAGLCVVIVLTGAARLQLSHWRNSFTLFQHALESTRDNHMAHSNLGIAFLDKNDLDEAIGHFHKALEIKPMHAGVHTNLSIAFRRKGMLDEALEHSIRSVQINPEVAEAHNNLGIALFQKGRVEEASHEFRQALKLKPDYTTCYYNLGLVLEAQNRIEEAAESFRQALRLDPGHREAKQRLALIGGSE
jgi:tetratricopeptide (TPR) repeat protein